MPAITKMREHVRLTINDMCGQIGRLQHAIATLRSLEDDVDGAPAEAAASQVILPAARPAAAAASPAGEKIQKSAAKAFARSKAAKAEKASSPRMQAIELTRHAFEMAKSLKPPFSAAELVAAVGDKMFTLQRAFAAVHNWKVKDLCVPAGKGRYALTEAFPASSGRLKIPGIDKPEETTQQAIERVLKGRDQARADGRDTMAQILQDKADKLHKQLVNEQKRS